MKIVNTKFIAEIGVNHNGSIKLAKKLIDHSSKIKADFVKFQVYKTEKLVNKGSKTAPYQKRKKNISQYDLLKKYELSYNQHQGLYNYCKKKKITYLASPFDLDSAKFLVEKLKLKTIKIASGEIESVDILEYLSKKKIKVIISTGASTINEIKNALNILLKNNLTEKQITILHCTTSYPARKNEINLKVMNELKKEFKTEIGYSDHSEGLLVSLAAYLLGAKIIEKHITLDRKLDGPDHRSSIEPKKFKELINTIRNLQIILGNKKKILTKSEKINKPYIRKSIYSKIRINKNDKFSNKNLILKRPQLGMLPKDLKKILKKKSKKIYKTGQLINE